jgi:hypothetical protein
MLPKLQERSQRVWENRISSLHLLIGAFLSSFSYAAGFRIEFSRQGTPPTPALPTIVGITLRSDWWIGNPQDWDALLGKALWKVLYGEPHDPMRAFAITWLCGAEVIDVTLKDSSDLIITTNYEKKFYLPGNDEIFEESWIIDIPRDIPNHEYWSVLCTNSGKLFCRYPASLDLCTFHLNPS